MQVELTQDEVAFLLDALNMVPVQGTEAMKRVLALAAKLEGAKDGGQEAPGKQGAQEAIQKGQGAHSPEGEVAMSPAHKGKHPMKKMPPKKHMMPKHHGKGKKK